MAVKTIQWNNNHVVMLDQRLLPNKEIYRVYRDYTEVARAIREMVIRGAPAIGVAAAMGVALGALRVRGKNFDREIERIFGTLAKTRPTAVNLFWALKRLLGKLGAKLLGKSTHILTHCNAGALATAGYGTALGVVRAMKESGKEVEVLANETRPFLQGARLTAWELKKDKIPVTLLTDNMVGYSMQHGKVDAVVVGCDRVAANGDVANKIGTYGIAVLARRHNIPFYVAGPTSSIDLECPSGAEIPIEQRDPKEVSHFLGRAIAPKGIRILNPAFDITHHDLVSAIITEKGVIIAPYDRNIRAHVHYS